MDEGIMHNIVSTLFPRHEWREDNNDIETSNYIPLFTIAELKPAACSLKNKKAPGPDGIPTEVIKEIAQNRPEMLLKMYNSCLKEGIFPDIWKQQKLVLISKGKGDPGSPSSIFWNFCLQQTTVLNQWQYWATFKSTTFVIKATANTYTHICIHTLMVRITIILTHAHMYVRIYVCTCVYKYKYLPKNNNKKKTCKRIPVAQTSYTQTSLVKQYLCLKAPPKKLKKKQSKRATK